MKKTHKVCTVLSAVTLIIAVTLFFWLFRSVTIENPKLGIFNYKYHWGILDTVTCDSNRDGMVDALVLIESVDNEAGSTGFIVLEGWESSLLDGFYDIHYIYKDNEEFVLEMDGDRDGNCEEKYSGDEAKEKLLEMNCSLPSSQAP